MFNTKKGNISMIVLFVLTITSLLGLLAFQNVKSMLNFNINDLFSQKSYYYSKAGLELGIALSNGYGIGFEDKISKNDLINKNFNCGNNKNCGVDFVISNRSRNFITNVAGDYNKCSEKNRFKLKEGESLIVPLFLDERKLNGNGNEFKSILNNFGYKPGKNLSFDLFLSSLQTSGTDILLSFAIGSGDYTLDRDVLFKIYTGITQVKATNLIDDFLYDTKPLYYKKGPDGNFIFSGISSKIEKFRQFPNFLVINYPTHCPYNSLNPNDIIKIDKTGKFNCKCGSNQIYSGNINKCIFKDGSINYTINDNNKLYINRNLQFCLKVGENLKKDGVATKFYLIDSKGDYGSSQTSLQASKKVFLPDWLFNTAIDRQF